MHTKRIHLNCFSITQFAQSRALEGKENLSKDVLRQIRALEESDSLSSTDTAISIQIRSPEIRIEQILAPRRPRRCHLRMIRNLEAETVSRRTRSNRRKTPNYSQG